MSLEPRRMRIRWPFGILLADLPFPPRMPGCWMPGCSFAYFVCLLSECLRRVTDLRPPTSIPNPLPSGILPPAWSVLRALAQKSKFKAIFELGKINKKIASCDGTCVLFPSRRSGLSHNEIIARWLKSIYANLRVHRPLQRIGRGIRTRTRRRRLQNGSKVVPLATHVSAFLQLQCCWFSIGFFLLVSFFLGVPPTKSADIPYI